MKPAIINPLGALAALALSASALAEQKMNVIFVTYDDLSRSSLGVYGSEVEDITPNMDRIANSGMRFDLAHVQASNCTPSRAFMMSGKYQQNSRIFSLGKAGAGNTVNRNIVSNIFRDAGYHTGIMGKNPHHNPFDPYTGVDVEYDDYGSTRDPQNVYEKTKAAIADAQKLNKPLYFNLNIFDPHTGWYGWDTGSGPVEEKSNHPSRIYGPDEVPYPAWFPTMSKAAQVGLPKPKARRAANRKGRNNAPAEAPKLQEVDMMLEVAAYYNTVKRGDDSLGKMLQALEEAGEMDNTIILLYSDHGVQLAGGKTTLYNEGTLSPLLVSWPGVVEPKSVNSDHFIGAIDLLPTFCEIAGQPIPHDVDGRSFVPMLKGEKPNVWRDKVYMQQSDRNKSRAIKNHEFLYIINPWADGTQRFGSVTTGMFTWKLFKDAQKNPETPKATRDWIDRIEFRTPVELYDIVNDPHCMVNLADDPKFAEQKEQMRQLMEAEILASKDHFYYDLIKDPSNPELMAKTIKYTDDYVAVQRTNPDYLRAVNFDPYDDYYIIDQTIFEPAGEWGIWAADGKGASHNDKKGNRDYGLGCIELSGSDSARMVTSSKISAQNFSHLKLELNANSAKLARAASLNFQYNDGSGWKTVQSIKGNQINGDHSVIFFENEEIPASVTIGVQAEFAGQEGAVFLDSVRLTGWQDWKNEVDVAAANKLAGQDATQAIGATIDASQLGIIEIDYLFSSPNFAAGDKLILEYNDGSAWHELLAHDYSYVLVAGQQYAANAKLKADDGPLPAKLQLRLRNATSGADKAVEVSQLKVKSRIAPKLSK